MHLPVNKIPLFYWDVVNNVGDQMSPYLISRLMGQEVECVNSKFKGKIVAIGSLLCEDLLYSDSVIWGTGSLTRNCLRWRLFPLSSTIRKLTRRKRVRVCAVRGPRTYALLQKIGLSCPRVFGDPAIILPRIYKPVHCDVEKKIGLILHCSQEHLLEHKDLASIGVRLISVNRKGDDQVEAFVNEVVSCSKVFSSSLHGLIVAQSYGVPAQWITLKDQPIHRDYGHKFFDYFEGTRQISQSPKLLDITADVEQRVECLVQTDVPEVKIEDAIVDILIESFPYPEKCARYFELVD